MIIILDFNSVKSPLIELAEYAYLSSHKWHFRKICNPLHDLITVLACISFHLAYYR